MDLVARVLEVTFVLAAAASVQRSTPSLRVSDGGGVFVEITTRIPTLECATSGVLGLEEAVVRPALGATGALLDLERDAQRPEHGPDELLLELGFVALRGRVLLTLPEVHNVLLGVAKVGLAELVPRFRLGEVLVEVVVREQVAIRAVGECRLHS
uniref:hypothetical protein n=1 Tax=Halostella pelagica TaxID=2583824 RepID=UPI001F175CA2|nr:hypothetical protein [Halostella pelagica]